MFIFKIGGFCLKYQYTLPVYPSVHVITPVLLKVTDILSLHQISDRKNVEISGYEKKITALNFVSEYTTPIICNGRNTSSTNYHES